VSTAYRVRPALGFRQLLDNLPAGIEIESHPESSERQQCLRDWQGNYLWVNTGDGADVSFECYGLNDAREILDPIAEKFGVKVYSEHEEEFWDPEDRVEGSQENSN
jgi:hypothetical protein